MLFITGYGRSGTSVLARLCDALGYSPGGSWREDLDAGYEDPFVTLVDQEFYEAEVAGRLARSDYILQGFCRVNRAVVKDPRLMFSREAIYFWNKFTPNLYVVMALRAPESVMASRARLSERMHRDMRDPDLRRTEPQHYVDSLIRFKGSLEELGVPHTVLHFPDFLQHPELVGDALSNAGLQFRHHEFERHWNKIVDTSRVHV